MRLIIVNNKDENDSISDYLIGEYPVISNGYDLVIPYEKRFEKDIKTLLKDEPNVDYKIVSYS